MKKISIHLISLLFSVAILVLGSKSVFATEPAHACGAAGSVTGKVRDYTLGGSYVNDLTTILGNVTRITKTLSNKGSCTGTDYFIFCRSEGDCTSYQTAIYLDHTYAAAGTYYPCIDFYVYDADQYYFADTTGCQWRDGFNEMSVTVTAPNAAPTLTLVAPADTACLTNKTPITFTVDPDDTNTGDSLSVSIKIVNAADPCTATAIASHTISSITTPFYQVSWPMPANSVPTTGSYKWCAQVTDGTDTSAWVSRSLNIDISPPALNDIIITSNTAALQCQQIKWMVSATDTGCGGLGFVNDPYNYKEDGATTWSGWGGNTFYVITYGDMNNHYVTFKVRDNLYNESGEKPSSSVPPSYTCITNTSPNSPTLVSPATNSWTKNSSITFSAYFSDPDTGANGTGKTNYRVAATVANCISGTTLKASGDSAVTTDNGENTTWSTSDLTTDGIYYWCARNQDTPGLFSDDGAYQSMGSIKIDRTPPVISNSAPSISGCSVTISGINATDAGIGLHATAPYSSDGSIWRTMETTLTETFAPGTTSGVVKIWVRDKLENGSLTPKDIPVTLPACPSLDSSESKCQSWGGTWYGDGGTDTLNGWCDLSNPKFSIEFLDAHSDFSETLPLTCLKFYMKEVTGVGAFDDARAGTTKGCIEELTLPLWASGNFSSSGDRIEATKCVNYTNHASVPENVHTDDGYLAQTWVSPSSPGKGDYCPVVGMRLKDDPNYVSTQPTDYFQSCSYTDATGLYGAPSGTICGCPAPMIPISASASPIYKVVGSTIKNEANADLTSAPIRINGLVPASDLKGQCAKTSLVKCLYLDAESVYTAGTTETCVFDDDTYYWSGTEWYLASNTSEGRCLSWSGGAWKPYTAGNKFDGVCELSFASSPFLAPSDFTGDGVVCEKFRMKNNGSGIGILDNTDGHPCKLRSSNYPYPDTGTLSWYQAVWRGENFSAIVQPEPKTYTTQYTRKTDEEIKTINKGADYSNPSNLVTCPTDKYLFNDWSDPFDIDGDHIPNISGRGDYCPVIGMALANTATLPYSTSTEDNFFDPCPAYLNDTPATTYGVICGCPEGTIPLGTPKGWTDDLVMFDNTFDGSGNVTNVQMIPPIATIWDTNSPVLNVPPTTGTRVYRADYLDSGSSSLLVGAQYQCADEKIVKCLFLGDGTSSKFYFEFEEPSTYIPRCIKDAALYEWNNSWKRWDEDTTCDIDGEIYDDATGTCIPCTLSDEGNDECCHPASNHYSWRWHYPEYPLGSGVCVNPYEYECEVLLNERIDKNILFPDPDHIYPEDYQNYSGWLEDIQVPLSIYDTDTHYSSTAESPPNYPFYLNETIAHKCVFSCDIAKSMVSQVTSFESDIHAPTNSATIPADAWGWTGPSYAKYVMGPSTQAPYFRGIDEEGTGANISCNFECKDLCSTIGKKWIKSGNTCITVDDGDGLDDNCGEDLCPGDPYNVCEGGSEDFPPSPSSNIDTLASLEMTPANWFYPAGNAGDASNEAESYYLGIGKGDNEILDIKLRARLEDRYMATDFLDSDEPLVRWKITAKTDNGVIRTLSARPGCFRKMQSGEFLGGHLCRSHFTNFFLEDEGETAHCNGLVGPVGCILSPISIPGYTVIDFINPIGFDSLTGTDMRMQEFIEDPDHGTFFPTLSLELLESPEYVNDGFSLDMLEFQLLVRTTDPEAELLPAGLTKIRTFSSIGGLNGGYEVTFRSGKLAPVFYYTLSSY